MSRRKKEKNNIKIAWRYLIVFAIFFAVFVTPCIIWAHREFDKISIENLRERLMVAAEIASTTVNMEKHERIVSPEDEDSPLYRQTVAPLEKIFTIDPTISSIYTLRPTNDENIATFVLDTAQELDENGDGVIGDNESKAHVGEEYDISDWPELKEGFKGPAADHEIGCDKWGCFLSGYAPLRDETGKVVALVGIDMDAKEVQDQQKMFDFLVLIFLGFCVACSLTVIALSMRMFILPISEIKRGIENFSSDSNSRIRIKNKDEFGIVAEKFNEMAARVQNFMKDLEKRVAERTVSLNQTNKNLGEAIEKMKEQEETRKNFVSYTAHELKNPLNVFRWSLEMLRNEDLGKINLEQREIIDQIYVSNDRLMHLVNDLLDVSRLDEARLKVQPAPCRIEDVIDEAAGNLAVRIKDKKINFVWKRPAASMPEVAADKERILQVILNLLGNAVKYTPDGKKVEIKVSETGAKAPKEALDRYGFAAKEGKYVEISIVDEGLGIPEAEQEKMFTRFFRASNVKKANIEGTGLGMFITFEIIKLHGGAVWFESEENKGTKFHFTLPVA